MEWLEQQSGIDIYSPTKPGRSKRGYTVFLHTPTYTGKECLVIHGFYIDKSGVKRRHYYNRKAGDKYIKNYYMVSIPKEEVQAVVKAIGDLMGSKPVEVTSDINKDLEDLGI